MLLIGRCQLLPFLHLSSHEAGLQRIILSSFFTKPPFGVTSLILYSDDFLWGKKLDYKCMHSIYPPSDSGTVELGFYFCFICRHLSYQCPSSDPLGSACPRIPLWCSQRALLISAPLFWDVPPTTTFCTHKWPKCLRWSHRRHQNGAHTSNVLRDTCTRFCTHGLNLSTI